MWSVDVIGWSLANSLAEMVCFVGLVTCVSQRDTVVSADTLSHAVTPGLSSQHAVWSDGGMGGGGMMSKQQAEIKEKKPEVVVVVCVFVCVFVYQFHLSASAWPNLFFSSSFSLNKSGL